MDPLRAQTPDGPTGGRRIGYSKRLLIFLVLLVMAGTVGSLTVRPLYRLVRLKRSRIAAEDSIRLLERGKSAEALNKARVAAMLAPGEAASLRAMARVAESLAASDSMEFQRALVNSSDCLREDLVRGVREAVRTQSVDIGFQWIQRLLREDPGDPEIWLLLNENLRQAGVVARLVAATEEACRRFPDNPRLALDHAQALLQSRDSRSTADATATLWRLTAEPSAVQLPAIQWLLRSPNLRPAEVEKLLELLDRSESSSFAHRFLAAKSRVERALGDRPLVIDRFLGSIPSNLEQGQRVAVAQWLMEAGETSRARRVLDEVSEEPTLPLILTRIDCLFASGSMAELKSVAESRSLPNPIQLAVRGAILLREGRKEEGELLLREALAKGRPYSELVAPFVRRHGEAAGIPALGIAALNTLLGIPGPDLNAARTLLRIHSKDRSLRPSVAVLRHLNKRLPSENSILLERVWMELILGENLDWATTQITEISKKAPDNLEVKYAMALAHWRAGKPDLALNLIESTEQDPSKLSPRQRAAYLLCLGAGGNREAARRMAQGLPANDLRIELEALIAPYR